MTIICYNCNWKCVYGRHIERLLPF